MNSVSIVLEWENAKGLEHDKAMAFLDDLGERITKPNDLFAHPVELIVVFDEDIERDALTKDFEPFVRKNSNAVKVKFLYAPDTPYYEKKGLAANYTNSDVIVYADSDCTYSENWLTDIISPIVDGEVDLVSGYTEALPGANFVERACELAWFFPTANPKDRLRQKFKNRFFGNNYAVSKNAISEVPIPRVSGSRSHAKLWISQLEAKGYKMAHCTEAFATHKQYDTWSEFFGRAWLLGKDKDVGVSIKGGRRGYRILRAVTAFFELTVKYLRRYFAVGLKTFSIIELIPGLIMGLLFQWTTFISQLLAALTRPSATVDSDYSNAIERSELFDPA